MCPPGVDQTTRSSQRWQIIAPRIRKIEKFPKDETKWRFMTVTPELLLFNRENRVLNFWRFLARVAAIPHTKASHATDSNRMSRIESLPSEVLSLILEDASLERKDVIALGFSSPSLWPHVLKHVAKACWLAQAPLAGVEIACTGTYLTDLPASFQKDDLAKSTIKFHRGGQMCEARKINWQAIQEYQPMEDSPAEWQAASRNLRDHLPESVFATLFEELLIACGDSIYGGSKDQTYVLRNLTTKQYVYCNSAGLILDPKIKNLHLNDVMLLNICWTRKYQPWPHVQIPEEAQRLELGKHQGEWAGHCFDIVPLDGQNLEGWSDYTPEVGEKALLVASYINPPVYHSPLGILNPSLKRKMHGEEVEWVGLKKRSVEF